MQGWESDLEIVGERVGVLLSLVVTANEPHVSSSSPPGRGLQQGL